MASPVLECRDVSAGHPSDGGPPHVVLSHVNFTADAEAPLVVIGRSGSGKSTLLRLLNRLEEPLAGAVLFEEKDVKEQDPLALRRKVALVLQTPVVFEGTVRENLRSQPRGARIPPEGELVELLQQVGLSADFLPRAADALSVGERQRVCLARALVGRPSALLLDEPTSAQDPRNVALVADLVRELAARHALTVVVATHQPELVTRLAGRVLLLHEGTARADVPGAELTAFFEGK